MSRALWKIGVFVLMLDCEAAYGQVYPRWFLLPEEIACPQTAVGVALTGFYPDSTGGPAFQDAVRNALRAEEELVEAGKQYFSAGEGTAVMGAGARETLDTSRLETLSATLTVLRLWTRGEMTAALIGAGSCTLAAGLDALVPVLSLGTPSWTTAPPADEQYDYAVGMSQPYYYESSSWQEAERNARLELARAVRLKVRTRDRSLDDAAGARYDALWDEAATIPLRGAAVARRWRDPATGVCLVLIRKPK